MRAIVGTTTVTATTTKGDQTIVVTTMTITDKTTITIGTTTTGMTDTTRGTHVMIGGILIEDRATTKGITTIIVGTLLKTNRAPRTHPGSKHQHKRPVINRTPPHTQIELTLATRL